MKRYGVIASKGNNSVILEVCDTREGVFVAKERMRDQHKDEGYQIDAIYGDFDEKGNLTENRYRILY